MSYSRMDGKDEIHFVTEEDLTAMIQGPEILSEVDEKYPGAINPDGNINWDCPCLGGLGTEGPCVDSFKEAFSCWFFSESEEKGEECVEKFFSMSDCMKDNQEFYDDMHARTKAESEAQRSKIEASIEEKIKEEANATSQGDVSVGMITDKEDIIDLDILDDEDSQDDVEITPVESTPIEIIPIENTPVDSTPIESITIASTPVEIIPAEIIPAEIIPAEIIPVEIVPVENTVEPTLALTTEEENDTDPIFTSTTKESISSKYDTSELLSNSYSTDKVLSVIVAASSEELEEQQELEEHQEGDS